MPSYVICTNSLFEEFETILIGDGSKWYHLKGKQGWYKAIEHNLADAVMLPLICKTDLMDTVRTKFQAP